MWWVCVCVCVAAPHDRVMPAVRIKLLQVWQIKTTERKRGERVWRIIFLASCTFLFLGKKKKRKKVIEKQPVFSQPTLVLVTKHRIHCAMVAMAMGAIYTYEWGESPDAVGRLSWWGAGAFAALTVWETDFFWPSLDASPLRLVVMCHRGMHLNITSHLNEPPLVRESASKIQTMPFKTKISIKTI